MQKHANEHAYVVKSSDVADLQMYTEAMACSDAVDWEMACDTEKRAFEHMGVYSRSKNCPNVSPFLTNLHQSNPNPKTSL